MSRRRSVVAKFIGANKFLLLAVPSVSSLIFVLVSMGTGCRVGVSDMDSIGSSIASIAMLTAVEDTENSSPLRDFYDNIALARKRAERRWINQEGGYLWMVHSRKAGGTTLCMTLRSNSVGLLQTSSRHFEEVEQETCQLTGFCTNCNIKKQIGSNGGPSLSGPIIRAMQEAGRNFIEFELNGVPVDVADANSTAWDAFVFVSSIRHPIERIVSSLKNDYTFRQYPRQPPDKTLKVSVGKQRPVANKKPRIAQCPLGEIHCARRFFNTSSAILERCLKGVDFCFSNYYVRLFSGLETEYTTDDDMLARAKTNFRRFSCVVWTEEFDKTSNCLHRIGLHVNPRLQYNVAGKLEEGATDVTHTSSADALLSEEERALLERLNHVDLEFYAWATRHILEDADNLRKLF